MHSDIYSETHYLPDEEKIKISGWLFKKLNKNSAETGEEIYILDAGAGDGSLFTIPLINQIKKFKNRNITWHLFAFDKHKKFINCLPKSNKNLEIKYLTNDFDTISFEELHKKLGCKKFDLIILTFFLHHLSNWRIGLLKLLLLLKEGGLIFTVERGGDVCAVDNIQWDDTSDNSQWWYFWKEYHELRKKYLSYSNINDKKIEGEIDWYPEISATNLKPIIHILTDCNKYFEEFAHNSISVERKYNTADLINWIKKKAFSHLRYWIITTNEQNFYKNISKYLSKKYNNQNFKTKETWKFYLFRRRTKDEETLNFLLLQSLRALDLVPYIKHAKKLIEESRLKIEQLYSIMWNFVQILGTWDLIAPQTLSIIANIHHLTPQRTWQQKRPILVFPKCFNNEELKKYEKNYLIFLVYLHMTNISITELIFAKMDNKPIITIEKINRPADYIEIEEKRNRDGSPLLVNVKVFLTDRKKEKIINQISLDDKKINDLYVNIDENRMYLDTDKLNNLFEEYNNKTFGNDDRRQIISKLLRNNLKNKIKSLRSFDKFTDEDIENFILICAFTQIIPYQTHLVFIPSEGGYVFPKGKDALPVSFGGVVLIENMNIRSITKKWDSKFQRNRISNIHSLVQIYFAQRGIEESQLSVVFAVYPYALRSAVAAIMARNMSHNIGSHVLNYLSNFKELDNLWVI